MRILVPILVVNYLLVIDNSLYSIFSLNITGVVSTVWRDPVCWLCDSTYMKLLGKLIHGDSGYLWEVYWLEQS